MATPDPYRVPKRLRERFDEIVAQTDAFASEHLDDEYAELSRRMAAALARKRPSPLERGEVRTWAAGIVHAVGWVNFLADPAQDPHMSTAELAHRTGVGQSTLAAKLREIRGALDLVRMEPEWTRPSKLQDNPLAWLIMVNGMVIDARHAPREIQEEAVRVGAIPYLPPAGPAEAELPQPGAPAQPAAPAPAERRAGRRPAGRERRDGGQQRSGTGRVYQLKITLAEIRPPIWRRVLVPQDVTLAELHRIIQAAMGWEDYHLWRFEIGGEEYGDRIEDDWGPPMRSARRARLGRVGGPGDVLLYEYDFGDAWEHRVRVEKALDAEPGREYPVCVAAERACPPEDSGGVWGYAEFLEAIQDPEHPEHESFLEWAGGRFDPEAVDLDEINRRLARTRAGARRGRAALPAAAAEPDDGDAGAEGFGPLFNQAEAAMRELRTQAEELLSQVLAENPEASIDELNAALQTLAAGHNLRPQAELGSLSPAQVRRLLEADWDGPASAVRLDASLPFAEIEHARTLHNARLFLGMLAERAPLKATPKGNLPRSFVGDFRERMRSSPRVRDEVFTERKILNEEDLFPLHLMRILLDLAGLIKRRKGALSLTRAGERLGAEERAGELFATLFRTHFRQLNLAYLDGVGPVEGFQYTVAVSLYRFGEVGADWRAIDELRQEIVLPPVRDELPPNEFYDPLDIVLETRLLRPLEGFGLAEERELPRAEGDWRERFLFRKTPLFDRFLSFDVEAG